MHARCARFPLRRHLTMPDRKSSNALPGTPGSLHPGSICQHDPARKRSVQLEAHSRAGKLPSGSSTAAVVHAAAWRSWCPGRHAPLQPATLISTECHGICTQPYTGATGQLPLAHCPLRVPDTLSAMLKMHIYRRNQPRHCNTSKPFKMCHTQRE